MSDNDNIVDKVAKLLAKARRAGSVEEAETFMAKVHEMVAKYELDMEAVEARVGNTGRAPIDEVGVIANDLYYGDPWIIRLWGAVGEAFFCTPRVGTRSVKRRRGRGYKSIRVMYFGGRQSNCLIAANMSHYLIDTVIRMAREASSKLPPDRRNNFESNFKVGCEGKLRDRLSTMRGGRANLPVPLQQEAKDALDEVTGKKTEERRLPVRITDIVGAAEGWAAGSKISLDQQVSGSRRTKAIPK